MSPLLRIGALLSCLTFAARAWQSYPTTDVIIVSNNDLDSSNPNRQGALFLRSSFDCDAARNACAAYDEALLPAPNGTGFTPANLSIALTSEKHGAAVETTQKIWIASSNGECAVFTPSSQYTDTYTEIGANSSKEYPVLCTNSAPITRSNVTADTSRQIDVSPPTAGKLYGYRDQFTFRFLGIKFGEAERFAAPTPYEVSPETERSTIAYGPSCAQPPDADNGHLLYTNEDCLYLNVFSPVVKTSSAFTAPRLPVMFFIHGGGLNTGSSGTFPFNMTTDGYVGPSVSNIYDGTNMVSYGGVVLVTIEYRLASFGWFNASNAAIKDALLALEWVQDNIEVFGGDPSKVLIFGESAGGTMTRYLLGVNPKYTEGLFSAAVLESDFGTSNPFVSPRIALNTSLALAKLVGCADNSTTMFTDEIAECAKEVPAADLVEASFDYGFSWDITVDGDLVLTDIATSIQDGVYGRVPTMFVSNECEYCYFLPTTILPTSNASIFPESLGLWFNATQIERILAAPTDLWPYAANDTTDDGITQPVLQLGRLMTDYYVHCPMVYEASLETNTTNRGNAYKVNFNVGLGSPLTPNPATCPGQVCHADELYYVFATAETDGLYQPLTPDQLTTTRDIMTRWTTLAWGGNPNYESAYPEWEPYTGDNEVVIGTPVTIESYRVAQCDWIEENLGLYFGYS